MAKKVTFSNKGLHALHEEIGPVNCLIESVCPQFDNAYDDHAKVTLLDTYCSLYVDGRTDTKPVVYFRHTDVGNNKYRFGNLLVLGDGPLDLQKGVLHHDVAADKDTPIDQSYGWVEDGVLGFGSTGKVEQRYYKDHVTIKEGDYMDLTAYPWEGFTLYDHQSTYINSSCVFQPSTFLGELDGKPVIGLGSFDRFCMKQHVTGGFSSVPMSYIALVAMGIRNDGRKEFCFASIGLTEGTRTTVSYKLEGEQAVICDTVEVEADWVHLPYVDDGTCVFENMTLYFGGKEVHFEGKWGTKGFLNEPRLEKHGQSQIFGTWYEGKTPYTHRVSEGFVENMEAYDHVLSELGFDVVK